MNTKSNSEASPPTTGSAVFVISPGYRKATLWVPKDGSRERCVTVTITPRKDLGRREKHAVISEGLAPWKITAPDYKPLRSEKNGAAEARQT